MSRAMPTCCPRAWARSDNGLPFSHSTSWKTICPPSRIGIGNRLRNPSDREMSTRKPRNAATRSEEHTSELQSRSDLVCRLLLEKKKKKKNYINLRSTQPICTHRKKDRT